MSTQGTNLIKQPDQELLKSIEDSDFHISDGSITVILTELMRRYTERMKVNAKETSDNVITISKRTLYVCAFAALVTVAQLFLTVLMYLSSQ